MENPNVAFCLDIIRDASRNRAVCVRQIAARHGITPPEALDGLVDLSLAGVLTCVPTGVPGFLSLTLGPKSLQAIFLFALNCDALGAFGDELSPVAGDLAIVGGFA